MSAPEDTMPEDTMPEDGGVTRDDPMIAAEWSLGLLEGEELLAARGKYATDPDFAWRKEWWDAWFAPMTDAMPAAEPGDHVWDGIAARLAAAQQAASKGTADENPASNVVTLETRLKRWQWAAGVSSAAAALALAWIGLAPSRTVVVQPQPVVVAAAAPLVATVPIGETGLRLDVTYVPDAKRMVVGAVGLTADGVHDHELWLVPADGSQLLSLGVVKPGEIRSMVLPENVTAKLGDGASLALTREPIGGKPAGKNAGPVVAKGAFTRV